MKNDLINSEQNIILTDNCNKENNCDNNELIIQSNTTPVYGSIEGIVVMGVVDIAKQSISCFTDYLKCKEHEQTERKYIVSKLRAIECQIEANKELYLYELDKQYEERNRLYSSIDEAKSEALKRRDNEMLQICFDYMMKVYNKPIEKNRYDLL